MKIKTEDILKPGAVLKVEKINWDDPEMKRLFEACRKEQERIARRKRWTQEQWDMLYLRITI
jgi:hypothetical protein